MSDAWEQRQNETPVAYKAFVMYRDMGADRSIRAVSESLRKSEGLLERWSRTHDWVARAQAWDKAQQAITDAMRLLARQQLIDDELNDYRAMLNKWRKVWESTDGNSKSRAADLQRLTAWRAAISTEGRRALGLPDKITQSQVTGNDGGKVQLEASVDSLAEVFAQIAEWERQQRDSD